MVSGLSIFIMFLNMILAIAIPVVLLVVIKKKFGASIISFVVGCVTFLVFALMLEQLLHALVIMVLPTGKIIQGNIWLYATYGALAAGVFEETGRLFAMKYMLKSKHEDSSNALMYGAGHGGFEVFYILGVSMLNNWLYSVMINAGQTGLILDQLGDAERVQMEAIFDQLTNTAPYVFLMAPVERISAVILHIALSVLVWTAVTKGKKWMYPLAIAFHFVVDFVVVVVNNFGLNVILLEILMLAMSVSIAVYAKKYVWNVYLKAENNSL